MIGRFGPGVWLRSSRRVITPAWTPADITSVTKYFWLKAALANVTLNGSNVSAWADTSGAANHFAQATAANQPLWTLSDSRFNGKPSVTGDGSSDFMSASVAGISATRSYLWAVVNQISYTSADALFAITSSSANAGYALISRGVSPQLELFDGTISVALNSGPVIGTTVRVGALWLVNNASSSLLIKGTTTAGNPGTRVPANPSTTYIFAQFSGLNPGNWAASEWLYLSDTPTELSNLEPYGIAEYGSGPFA